MAARFDRQSWPPELTGRPPRSRPLLVVLTPCAPTGWKMQVSGFLSSRHTCKTKFLLNPSQEITVRAKLPVINLKHELPP